MIAKGAMTVKCETATIVDLLTLLLTLSRFLLHLGEFSLLLRRLPECLPLGMVNSQTTSVIDV